MSRKRIWSGLLTLVFCLGLLPATALAAGDAFSVTKAGGEEIISTENEANYTEEYSITEDVTVTGSTVNGRLIVTQDDVAITLENASMDLNWCKGSPIEIAEDISVTLILEGENTLSAFANGPGILVNQGATLTIQSSSNGTGSLTVSGAKAGTYAGAEMGGSGGTIYTEGYAGIGGPNFETSTEYTGTINIQSGAITATGYSYGAGIGGGDYSSGGTINISGGVVTAFSGGTDSSSWATVPVSEKRGAGIGGSQGFGSGVINISGDAQVTAYGGEGCPGIGGAPCDVTISGQAEVTGYGGALAAGVGGYDKDKGGTNQVTVSDAATVTAYGGKGAAGLGEGSGSSAAKFDLTIASGANVTAYSDGTKTAFTGTPSDSSAPVVNMQFDPDLTIPSQVGDIPLTLTGTDSSATKTLTVPKGYRAAATTMPEGTYTATAAMGGQNIPLLGLAGTAITSNDSYTPVLVSIPQVPGAPQDLKAVSGDGQATLTWTAPEKVGTGPITGYTIYWSTEKPSGNAGQSDTFQQVSADTTTATVTGLTNGTAYYFWAAAENHAGAGAISATVTAIPATGEGPVEVDNAEALEAALENDAITDIKVVGSFTYSNNILQEKNITVVNGVTLTLKYQSGYGFPHGARVCNSNIQVEQGGTLVFLDACWWSNMFSSPSIHSYLLLNGDFTLAEGASAYTEINTGSGQAVTKPGYILFRGDFTNNGSFINHASTGAEVYLNYGATPGTFTDTQSTGFSPKYNLCISDPTSIEPPQNYAGLADLALSLIDIEGGAYVGGQLKAVVDGFGPVEQGGPFSVIWNSTGAATDTPYSVQEADRGSLITAALDENGALGQDYGYFLVSDTTYGPMAYQIFKFDTTSVNQQIASFAVNLDVNGGDALEEAEAVLLPNAEGKLTALPTPTHGSSNYTFVGWFTEASGGEEVTTDTVFTQDATIYAHWKVRNSGGGSSSRPAYPPVVEELEGGDVTITPANPRQDDTVTITPEPEEGKEVDEVTVLDQNGNALKVEDMGDGTYTFTQPTGKATISVTFRDVERTGLPFVDVETGTWYYDAVEYAYENSLMTGTSATTFSPDNIATRAQMATILWRLADSPVVNYLMDFEDADPAAWYSEAVRWAVSEGIMAGYGNGQFGPNDPITREQFATILYRYEQNQGGGFTGTWAFPLDYEDAEEVSSWAYEAMCWMTMKGVISGTTPNALSPQGQATRAQVATMLMQYLEIVTE